MSYTKKATLIGVGVIGIYAALAIVAYLIYGATAYSAYDAENSRLGKQYQAQMAQLPVNAEKRKKLEAEWSGKWDVIKAEIESRQDEALASPRREYWSRMARAKKKRDSADMLTRMQGSTEELEAENAWRTDTRPISAQFSEEESQAHEKFRAEEAAALEQFDKDNPSEYFTVTRQHAPASLLPSMSRDELQKLLKLIGFGVLAVYVALACIRAAKAG